MNDTFKNAYLLEEIFGETENSNANISLCAPFLLNQILITF